MSDIQSFRQAVESFIAARGWTPTRFGRAIAGDPLFVFDLREGREPRSDTRQRILKAMQEQAETAAQAPLRIGVAGRLEWNAAAAVGDWPVWDTSLSRGPAQRAAVVLGPFAAPISPNGALPIGFDENLAADLPARRTVTVTFDGTALDAAGIAARIDAALRVGGAGAAAAWPDGRIVVETATSGLAGTVPSL